MYDSNKYIITQTHNTEININRIAVLRAAVEIFALHINNFSSFCSFSRPIMPSALSCRQPMLLSPLFKISLSTYYFSFKK